VQTAQCDVGGGERCDLGVCIPPCQNACTAGARQCASKNPQRCEVGPTGCTIWRDEGACPGTSTCVTGGCYEHCGSDELETCAPAGTICTGLPEGRFCLPGTGSGGGNAGGGTATAGGNAGGGSGTAGGTASGGGATGAGGGTGSGGGVGSGGGTASGSGGGTSSSAGGSPVGGSAGGTGSNVVGVDGPSPNTDRIGAKGMGCGCSSADGAMPFFVALALVGLSRRRAR
jgi:uncharacterized protein (TIGR03382 family)